MELTTNPNNFATNKSNNDDSIDNTSSNKKKRSKISSEQAWNNKFQELYTFYVENGHSDVPQTYKKNKSLGKWVSKQREQYKTYVEFHKQQNLNGDNHPFRHNGSSINDTNYNNVGGDGNNGNGDYANHYQYNNNDGNNYPIINPTTTATDANSSNMVKSIKKKSCPLTQERISKLQSVNFKFVMGKGQHGTFTSSDTMIQAWEDKFKLLQEYKCIYGHVDVVLSTSSLSKNHDSSFKNNKTEQPQETTLAILRNQNGDMVQYNLNPENGSTNDTDLSPTPIGGTVNNEVTTRSNKTLSDYQMKSLGRWLQSQKRKYKEFNKEILSTNVVLKDRFQRLIDIGVELECGGNSSINCIDRIVHCGNHHNLNRHQNLWYTRYNQLCEFKDKFGHANVSLQNCESNSQLVRWVATQRELWKVRQKQLEGQSNALSDEKITLLKKIGFEFSIYDKTFHSKLNELKLYKEQHGHIHVRASDNKSLYDWIHRQRALFREYMEGNTKHRSSMTNERIVLLEEIGFDWRYNFEVIDREKVKAAVASASTDKNSRNRLKRTDTCKNNNTDEPQETNSTLFTPGGLNEKTNLESSSNRISDMWNESDTQNKCSARERLDGSGTVPFRDNISTLHDGDRLCLNPQSIGQHKKGTKPHLWKQNYDSLVTFQQENGHCRVPGKYLSNPKLGYWVKLQREGE
jgi:hypothetical protein